MSGKLGASLSVYRRKPLSFVLFLLAVIAMLLTAAALLVIIIYILINGVPHLSPQLLFGKYSSENPSLSFSIVTTLITICLTLLIAVPLGIFCAIYLTEYARRGSMVVKLVRVATETLSGIPSIVYGLFGALFFGGTLGLGYSILSGVCTAAIMILPTMIRSTEEAVKSVPDTYREGSLGLGASRFRTVFKIVLPSASKGILAAVMLSIGRIIGETAAFIYTLGTNAKMPGSLLDSSRTLSIHMYINTRDGGASGRDTAFATGVVLIAIVLILNLLTTYLLSRSGRKLNGKN